MVFLFVYAASAVNAVAGLSAANIKDGTTVGGVTGTYKGLGNATTADVLSGKTFSTASLSNATGTIVDRGNNQTGTGWGSGGSGDTAYYSISSLPAGYYHKTGTGTWEPEARILQTTVRNSLGVTAAKILKGQTIASIAGTATSDATAAAANILSGKTAYVNGSKITGTMTDRGAVTSSLNCGGSYTIPAGYHNGSGKVTANSLSSQTSGTATAANILSGKTAWVNGSQLTGTIASLAGSTYTPSTSSQTVSCSGKYMTSNITINAIPSNYRIIKYGTAIPATSSDYLLGSGLVLSTGVFSAHTAINNKQITFNFPLSSIKDLSFNFSIAISSTPSTYSSSCVGVLPSFSSTTNGSESMDKTGITTISSSVVAYSYVFFLTAKTISTYVAEFTVQVTGKSLSSTSGDRLKVTFNRCWVYS